MKLNLLKIFRKISLIKTLIFCYIFNSLHFIKLNDNAKQIFSQLFDEDINKLEKTSGSEELIESAKNHPEITYTDDALNVIVQLKNIFGDEKIMSII